MTSKIWLERFPRASADMRIGVMGGAFNPVHEGHKRIALDAFKRLRLDRVWWSVSPGHILKAISSEQEHAEMRAQEAAFYANDPRIEVTAAESAYGFYSTIKTVHFLKLHFSGVRFVFIIGADNLTLFHLWDCWQELLNTIPFVVFDRPGHSFCTVSSPAAQTFARFRLPTHKAALLPTLRPPAWSFIHGSRLDIASRYLRDCPYV